MARERKKWQEDVHNLALEWAEDTPENVVNRLEEIESQMSSNGRVYPRLTNLLAYQLASMVPESLEYTALMLDSTLSGDILAPFLYKVVKDKSEGWENLLVKAVEGEKSSLFAVEVILTSEEMSDHLVELALTELGKFPSLIRLPYLRGQIPEDILPMLFQHPEPLVIFEVVEAEWGCNPRGKVREHLRSLWEDSVLNYFHKDYWLAEIFVLEKRLAFEWLKQNVVHSDFPTYRYDRAISTAISVLNSQERLSLLEMISVQYGYHKIVAQLIGNDLPIYRELLASRKLEHFHLAPLAFGSGENWKAKAKMAYSNGYSAQEIVANSVAPVGRIRSWSGRESEQWKGWLTRFEEVIKDHDHIISQIGQAGIAFCTENLDRVLKKEHDKDVYGL